MVFIITSPFPFHFFYKLVQVTCCVPERADQQQPAEMHLQNHHSGAPHRSLLSFPFPSAHPFIFLALSPPSALFLFILSPILVFASLSFFPFLLLPLFSSFLLFFFFFFPHFFFILCLAYFFSPYTILLVLLGSYCYFINFRSYKDTGKKKESELCLITCD